MKIISRINNKVFIFEIGENGCYHAPTGGVAVMPTVTTIVRGNTKEHTPNGREEGDVIDGGLSHVRPPPPPVPPPMGNKISGTIKTLLYIVSKYLFVINIYILILYVILFPRVLFFRKWKDTRSA